MSGKEHWKNESDEHDFAAAFDYLTLLVPDRLATTLVTALRASRLTTRKAKDLLRASRLPLLPKDNMHVAKDLSRVQHGTPLSPVLVVRGNLVGDHPLTIADGYHRICASYHVDEDADIPCHFAEFPAAAK